MESRRPEPGRAVALGVAALLLAAFVAQAVGSMRLLTASGDETVHLPAGYSYLATGRLRLNPEHPPLIKQLCALPLLLLRPQLDLDDPAWRAEPPDQAAFGYRFLYGNDADRLLFWGRLPTVLLAVLLGALVACWAAELFGRAAGLLALGLYVFCPNVIAHARYVTMDLGLACFFTACLYLTWRYVRHGGRANLALAGVTLGLALGAKFSAVILLPALALLLALAALSGRGGWRAWALAGAAMLALAGLVVWAVYLFPLDPSFYLDGMREVNRNHRPDYAEYLMGQFAIDGWWHYFIVAFLVKTPLPTLVLLAAAAATLRRRRAGHWLDEAFLLLPAGLFFVVTSALADDIGVRYLLPVYPLAFVFAGRLAPWALGSRRRAGALALLGLWLVFGTVRSYPDQLAYFNELAGGPRNGHRWLDDSNIDWGQDLKRLRSWMDRQGVERVRLIQGPWNGNPDYYGVRWEPVRRSEWRESPEPGATYVVSTHMLIRGELVARRQGTRNNWLSLYEPVDRIGWSFYVFRFD